MGPTALFGRYRLVARAGTGGSAQVWRAVDERTGDEVAVKRLHPIVFASEAGRQRLVREFRALRDLQHANIVPVRGLEIDREEAALVLDFVDGPSLRERLSEGVALRAGEAVRIASDVAAALDAAHRSGLVHRDVSPGNILLAADGTARLTDFGIARSDADVTAVTATGVLVGTLRYVAPELLRGEAATPSTDVYGLAAVTYEMLAGRPPFRVATPVALVEAQRAGAAAIGTVSPELDAIVRRALDPEPANRPVSAGAFAAQLRNVAPGSAADSQVTEEVPLPPISAGRAGTWADLAAPAALAPVATRFEATARPAAAVPVLAAASPALPGATGGAALPGRSPREPRLPLVRWQWPRQWSAAPWAPMRRPAGRLQRPARPWLRRAPLQRRLLLRAPRPRHLSSRSRHRYSRRRTTTAARATATTSRARATMTTSPARARARARTATGMATAGTATAGATTTEPAGAGDARRKHL